MRATDIGFLAEVSGGKLLGEKKNTITNVVIDSRAAGAASLFVCVVGEKNNGHDYWEKAYELGCRAFLMSDPAVAAAAAEKASVILVSDTEKGFVKMASGYLDQFSVILIGVTGSVGKTSTKALTAAVLSAKYRTVCTQKNLITQLGLCLTCFLADDDTEAIVFEMGMDRKDEIHGYCEWIRPEAVLITMIGISHMERLGSRSAICDAKLEITDYLPDGAPLFYHEDDEFLYEEEIRRRKSGNFVCCPVLGPHGQMTLSDVLDHGLDGISFVLSCGEETQHFRLPLLGLHNARNAALACAVGLHYGVSLKMAAEKLCLAESGERRLNAENVGGICLIDDSYNAAPDSMIAAIDVLAGIECERRIAVLSDMRELGDGEAEGHRRVGRRAAEQKIEYLLFVGEKTNLYLEGVNEIGFEGECCLSYASTEDAIRALAAFLKKGDAVLVKGSNATHISDAAGFIREEYSK